MTILYRYEAKSIQSWILGTDRLAELAGGSSLVESLEAHARQRVQAAGGEFLYGAAGSGTASFRDLASLDRFASRWPAYVARLAPGLELVQAWTTDGTMSSLQQQLGRQRNQLWPALPEAGPWMARAGRSGLPAGSRDASGGLLDPGARARANERERVSGTAGDGLGQRLAKAASEVLTDPLDFAFATDLQQYPSDEGLALIHADGNGLGAAVRAALSGDRPFASLQRFSLALSQVSNAAAARAVVGLVREERDDERTRRKERQDGALPVFGRPIVAGGDDFTFLVRGRFGLALAVAWLSAFERGSRTTPGLVPLTACAGVVFVRNGFPFAQAHELAEELCKQAKKTYREKPAEGSRVAFERVTTALHDVVTSASWTLGEMHALAQLVADLGALGARGKVREWAATDDPALANERWKRIREVSREECNVVDHRLEAFGKDRHRAAVRAALQWSRIQPGAAAKRLWSEG